MCMYVCILYLRLIKLKYFNFSDDIVVRVFTIYNYLISTDGNKATLYTEYQKTKSNSYKVL